MGSGKGKKGTRDILKQLEEREHKIKDKINHPPKPNDDQPMSKRMKEFVARKEAAKTAVLQKQQHRRVQDDFKESELPTKKSTKRDLRRIENELTKRKLESQFASKYNVQIIRDDKTGEIRVKKDVEKVKEKKQLLKDAKVRIQKEIEEKKKTEKKEVVIEQDSVGFGETNKQPPNLIKIKKTKNLNLTKKAWQKGNLLLNKMK
jgi:hypothetical protein